MALLSIPDPVSILEAAETSKLERETINSLVSSAYSAQIAFLWRVGGSKVAVALGMGQAMRDAATSQYLSLRALEQKGFLTLTVPKDLLDGDNVARFQTEYKSE
jgi:hypothetical protein